MADIWFRKLGFSRNPFTIKPAAFSYELFGANIGSVLSGIEDGKILFVEAPLGHGKTTLLKGIISRFGGRKKVVYAHALPSQGVDVKELLKRSSLANFITGSLPSGMVLVVDEAQNIMEESSSQIMEFYKSGNIRAVVFFGTSYQGSGFAGELKAMMNGNMVRLSRPTPEQAVSLVRSRIGNLPLLSNEAILVAYRKAQGNPRRLLQICEDMCRLTVGEEGLSVSPSKIPEVSPFADAEAAKPEKVSHVAKRKPKPVKRRVAARQVASAVPKPDSPVFHRPAEVAPMAYVSSTSESVMDGAGTETVPVVVAPVAKQVRKLKRKAPSLAAKKFPASSPAKKAPARARKKSGLPKPIAKADVDVSDSSNESGHYWGEFMGMQK